MKSHSLIFVILGGRKQTNIEAEVRRLGRELQPKALQPPTGKTKDATQHSYQLVLAYLLNKRADASHGRIG